MKRQDEVFEHLRRVPLFNNLSAAELEPLTTAVRIRKYARHTSIFREGDTGDALFVISAGNVKISRSLGTGDEIVFAVLEPGDAFGELAILQEHAVRSADATAVADAECLVLRRDAVVDFLLAHPAAMWHVITMLVDHIKRKDEGFVDLAVRDIPSRVARKLLELAGSRAEQGRAGEGVRLSQTTLAGLVGASRENVNRALRRFVSLGYIKLDRGRIVVLRPEELQRRGG